jgi:hypothetical protein
MRGASVWAWPGRQSATRRSRSKSEPPWARLTTWWTSRRVRSLHAWQTHQARLSTWARVATQVSWLADGRPRVRSPLASMRRRAARPTRVWPRRGLERMSVRLAFARVGKPRTRRAAGYSRRSASGPSGPPPRGSALSALSFLNLSSDLFRDLRDPAREVFECFAKGQILPLKRLGLLVGGF